MDKESSVRSILIPDKVYKTPINTLDNEDNELETDLYKIKIFGKNVIIAPGKIKSVNPKFIYFYVYAIKNEKVAAKLGVYEKELSSLEENPDIYDLTKFKDGSLLLFDVYYNTPDLINDLEELETLEEGEEEEEEIVKNVGKNVKLELAEVIIDGNDYIMRDGQIFDLNDKKVGTKSGINMIAWNNNSKPKSNLQVKDTLYNAFDYLKQAILINKINVLNDEEQSGLVSKLRLLIRDQATNVSQKGKNIAERRKLTNILNEMFTAKNEMLLTNPKFFDNLKKIQKLKSAQNVIKTEEKTVIMLYILENFLDVQFVFKTKDYMDFDISKIINIKFAPNEMSMNKKKVIVLINDMSPFAEIASIKITGTSLNEDVGLSTLDEELEVTEPTLSDLGVETQRPETQRSEKQGPEKQGPEKQGLENEEPAEFNEEANNDEPPLSLANKPNTRKPNTSGKTLTSQTVTGQPVNRPGATLPTFNQPNVKLNNSQNYQSNVELSSNNESGSNNNQSPNNQSPNNQSPNNEPPPNKIGGLKRAKNKFKI